MSQKSGTLWQRANATNLGDEQKLVPVDRWFITYSPVPSAFAFREFRANQRRERIFSSRSQRVSDRKMKGFAYVSVTHKHLLRRDVLV